MNAVARGAIEKFGELPQEIMDGTCRSRFAPPLVRRQESGRTEAVVEETNVPDAPEEDTGETSTSKADDEAAA
jgi:hypothetical protein